MTDTKVDSKAQFLSAVDRVAEIATARQAIHEKLQELRDQLHVMQSRHILDVGTARDPKGKAVYSNEELRRAALTFRLSEDSVYQSVLAQARKLEREDEELVVEHNRVVDQKALMMIELGLAPRGGEDIPQV